MLNRVLFIIFLVAFHITNSHASCNLGVEADFLWWKASDDDLNNSVTVNNLAPAVPITTTTDYFYEYGWDPGVRLGFTYEGIGCCANYNLFGTWTWFRGTDNNSITRIVGPDESVSITMINNFSLTSAIDDEVLAYSMNTDFLYNRFDLGIRTDICCESNFMLEASLAFTYAYIHQTLHERGTRSTFVGVANTDSVKTCYPGYGITLGGELAYILTNSMFIYSKGSVTGLWGNYSIEGIADSATAQVVTTIDTNIWRGRFICGLELGLEYNTCMCNRFPLSAQLGWQFQYLPMIDAIRAIFSSDKSGITINGLVAGLELEF